MSERDREKEKNRYAERQREIERKSLRVTSKIAIASAILNTDPSRHSPRERQRESKTWKDKVTNTKRKEQAKR